MTDNPSSRTEEQLFEERLNKILDKRLAEGKHQQMDEGARGGASVEGAQPSGNATPKQSPKQPLNLVNNFSFKAALRTSVWTGGLGLALYSARTLFNPAKNLFLAGPRKLADLQRRRGVGRFKNNSSVIALVAAQAIGIGMVGEQAVDYARDNISFDNSNSAYFAAGGVSGFALNQIRLSTLSVRHGHTDSFLEALLYNSLNSSSYLLKKAGNAFADFTTSTAPLLNGSTTRSGHDAGTETVARRATQDSPRQDAPVQPTAAQGQATQVESLPATQGAQPATDTADNTQYVQICTSSVNHGNRSYIDLDGNYSSESIAAHFNAANNTVNEMKLDQNGALLNTLMDKSRHALLIVPPYNNAAQGITLQAVYDPARMVCNSGYISVRYNASEWTGKPGVFPKNLAPVR